MKRQFISIISFILVLTASISLSACSNLFENVFNEDMTFKNGDDSLLQTRLNFDEEENLSTALVVIKNSERKVNQISYKKGQNLYFVGTVPEAYSDYKADYKNGSKRRLLGKDGPVELRCFVNDINARVEWTLTQTWSYIPQEDVRTTSDMDGNTVSYRGIKEQKAEKLASPLSVNFVNETKDHASYIFADLPYGVTVASCKVIADDEQYSSEYKIILTKEYITTIADSPDADSNNVTEHGFVVIKASDPGRNAINYSSTVYEYEVGDSSGNNPELDLTGRDDSVVFKCFNIDEKAELSWSARQTKEYLPVWDANASGITSQTLKTLDKPIDFDVIGSEEKYTGTKPYLQFVSDSNKILKSDLPYGVTEVYASITAWNTDSQGNLVSNVTRYKVTLTKRYIITSAANVSGENEPGLSTYINGKNMISFSPSVLNYSVDNLNGADEYTRISFTPAEPLFTETNWTAVKTHSYIPETHEASNGKGTTYTYQTEGTFEKLESPLNLIEEKKNSSFTTGSENGVFYCQGPLPYGKTLVSVSVKSLADKNSSTTYTILLTKKQVSTKIDIVASNGEAMSTITNRGLVALGAQNESLNRISFNPEKHEYNISSVQAADNDMKFRSYLADSDANMEWTTKQIVEFEEQISEYTETVRDPVLGIEENKTYRYISGQTETSCNKDLTYTRTDKTDANEIKLFIPYGITEVTAKITSENEPETIYKITLRRDICAEPVSEEDFKESLEEGRASGNYSQLEKLKLTLTDDNNDSKITAKLTPAFNPTITNYNLVVDENADSLSFDAIAADANAEISEPLAITKYGRVPPMEGMNVCLVGGRSRITFTVTDETQISRTYTFYVEKPEDGDTRLKEINYTPSASYENGIEGFTFDSSFKGASTISSTNVPKYKMTLSADSRKDVTKVDFLAQAVNKRTLVSYGISSSNTILPTSWQSDKISVAIGNENTETIKKYLWIKTVSNEYFHTNDSGYENVKQADTSYHTIELSKAGDSNSELTALNVQALYEDGSEKEVISQTSNASKEIAFQTKDQVIGIDKITTFADQLVFYYRPLDKDANLAVSVKNNNQEVSSELVKKEGPINESCEVLNDSSLGYYKLTIGSIEKGLNTTTDLPMGTTSVTIGKRTYKFTKPDLKNVNYSLGLDKGERKWDNYIYLKKSEASLIMNLTSQQQNQELSISSCQHIADTSGAATTETDVPAKIIHGKPLIKWTVDVTDIPFGTTKLVITVNNSSTIKDYTYYIVREDENETRLKELSFDGFIPANFSSYWKDHSNEDSFSFTHKDILNVDAGDKILKVVPVNPEAYITIERKHSASTSITAESADWEDIPAESVTADVNTSNGARTLTASFTEDQADSNAGTIMYTIKVAASETAEITHIYNFLIRVKADTNANLKEFTIIQHGQDMDRTILANSFTPDIFEYTDLSASLNYKGPILIKAVTESAKAKITKATIECDGQTVESESYITDDGSISIPYDNYIENRGKAYLVTYTVQAQDASITSVNYSAEISIPNYQQVTETTSNIVSTEYDFFVPLGTNAGLAYRFGSVISAESLPARGYFGGIDIAGSPDGSTWYESSFGGSGFQFVLNIDGSDYWLQLNENGSFKQAYTYDGQTVPSETELPEGINFSLEPQFVSEGDNLYLELEFNIENTNGYQVKLGAAIDTLIGKLEDSKNPKNDRVKVQETNNGFTMAGKNYSFTVVLKNAYNVDDVSSLWYGAYDNGDFLTRVFDQTQRSGLRENEDSAASFYWDLGNAASSSKKIRITMLKLL